VWRVDVGAVRQIAARAILLHPVLWRNSTGDAVSDGRFTEGNTAALKHGLESRFARTHDETVLTEPQHSRLIELRCELETPAGVLDAAIRQAADAELIREWGAAFLKEQARTVGPVVFAHPILSRYFTSAESARRALLAVSQLHSRSDSGGINAADVLESIRNDKGQ
jgi:hypothetical protein